MAMRLKELFVFQVIAMTYFLLHYNGYERDWSSMVSSTLGERNESDDTSAGSYGIT
jgi:hypothetical protein